MKNIISSIILIRKAGNENANSGPILEAIIRECDFSDRNYLINDRWYYVEVYADGLTKQDVKKIKKASSQSYCINPILN
ncbi:hypothetical protein HYU07_05060 [Candidatus Woesearchaeota archaeon]|nr:hypothetical protein [Candidatus Woesearchaeota archaeon]